MVPTRCHRRAQLKLQRVYPRTSIQCTLGSCCSTQVPSCVKCTGPASRLSWNMGAQAWPHQCSVSLNAHQWTPASAAHIQPQAEQLCIKFLFFPSFSGVFCKRQICSQLELQIIHTLTINYNYLWCTPTHMIHCQGDWVCASTTQYKLKRALSVRRLQPAHKVPYLAPASTEDSTTWYWMSSGILILCLVNFDLCVSQSAIPCIPDG